MNSGRLIRAGAALAAMMVLAAGCAGKRVPPAAVAPPPPPPDTATVSEEPSPPPPPVARPAPRLYHETGTASWYGREFQGRKTASGEIFDTDGFSAAHRTLPLGTVVRVTNLENSRSVEVKITDRGPFVGNRILELSYAAARELGFIAQGTARVKIEAEERLRKRGTFTVQAAVFSEEENAMLLKDRLSRKFESITVLPFDSHLGTLYRVEVGSYGTQEKAETVAGRLKKEGLEPYVMRRD